MDDKKNESAQAKAAQAQSESTAAKATADQGRVFVKMIRGGLPAGKAVVFTQDGQGFITRERGLEQTAAWQEVSREDLEDAYDFEEEIAERMPTAQQVRLALLRQGIVKKSDLNSRENQQFFNNLFPRI